MSVIDIRTGTTKDVDTIIFAEDSYGYGTRLIHVGGYVQIVDVDKDKESDVRMADIDNLILALQKAKELGWGT